jgi:hypothetical protein
MRNVDQIQKQGTGPYVIKKGEVGEIVRACKAMKLPGVSPWNRRKKKAPSK